MRAASPTGSGSSRTVSIWLSASVLLARVLFAEPDFILLDEPTNHLDSDAKAWLMDFLRDNRGAVIVVSHDLLLLDAAITRVIHLNAGRLVEYRGTYSQYKAAR